ncbi:hypothetical protein BV898_20015, partial [Hypsibius exemplaris]
AAVGIFFGVELPATIPVMANVTAPSMVIFIFAGAPLSGALWRIDPTLCRHPLATSLQPNDEHWILLATNDLFTSAD